MKFRSPGDEPLHISLISGHTLVIPAEGVEVPDMFRREAIARGAEPLASDGSVVAAAPKNDDGATGKSSADNRKDLIKEALRTMLNGSNEEDFTAAGTPNLKRLQAVAGFQVSRADADAAWAEVQAEAAQDGQ
ncbi:hypothetical protein ACLS0R_11570 [Comamonas jiangduensis]|uniref:hypothetical protein n=1 Tax=Comamonas jiangduensis TaxID=1194168 RepID=UPI003BF8E9B2